MKLTEQLVAVADTFCAARRLSRARVSTIVLNQGGRLELIAAGTADITTGRFERAMQWFSDNWPGGTIWPEAVARPAHRVQNKDSDAERAA